MKLPAKTSIPAVARSARADPVGDQPGHGSGDQHPDRHRQQEDSRPQRRVRVVVSVQRQPDALQPDDEHELESAACHGYREPGRVARRELTYSEQFELEHGLVDPEFDDDERDEQHDSDGQRAR